ncbi:MAG: hypothetical protein HRU18_12035 [Pseudoalteromonas sp.]|uniref:hypothetical protein n=1 Tax=Pseudoalteromonas sp. TaxID=53249 RepID=UPI001DC5ECD7|nr:hypothetical protein [Pseudoalteromonas sp.]NRA78931.1 hypothetical protein [Pseudoalteromonas sp.]
MINFEGYKKQLADIQKEYNSVKNIPERIRSVANKLKESDEKTLLNDVTEEFSKALKDAEKGETPNFNQLLNRAENIANGYESKNN